MTPYPSHQCREQFRSPDFLTEEVKEAIISGEALQTDPDGILKKFTAINHKVSFEEVPGKTDDKLQRHIELGI